MEPRFLDYVGQEDWAKLVGSFATATATIIVAVNVEDIISGVVQGP